MVGGNKNKGNGTIAEAQVLVKLLQQGFGASWAIGDSMGWDLVSDWQGKVTRLQVKSTQVAHKGHTFAHPFWPRLQEQGALRTSRL